MIIFLFCSGLLVPWAASSYGATIRVAKTPPLDYSVLQDALDAAAPGDTIAVGPGRYDQFQLHDVIDGTFVQSIGWVQTEGITLIGDDRETVFVGPETQVGNVAGVSTVAFGVDRGIGGLYVRGITFQNTNFAFSARNECVIETCSFEFALSIALLATVTNGLLVRESSFFSCEDGVVSPVGSGNSNLQVVGCQFLQMSTFGVDFSSVDSGLISGCYFSANRIPIQIWNSEGVVVDSNETSGVTLGACGVTGGNATLIGNRFGATTDATFAVKGGAVVFASGNHIGAGQGATMFIQGSSRLTFNHGLIEPGNGPSVLVTTAVSEVPAHDLRNNYWGTTDLAVIEKWISDGDDNPFHSIVEFEPIATSPIPTRKESMSTFRSKFGP